MIVERVNAGLARAKANGVKLGAETERTKSGAQDAHFQLGSVHTPALFVCERGKSVQEVRIARDFVQEF